MRCILIPFWILSLGFTFNCSARGQAKPQADVPSWVKDAGARSAPNNPKIFSVNSYGATVDGLKNSTKAIQQAIDSCSGAGGGIVTFDPGQYVTGALFLKSNVHLRVAAGVTLLG